MEVRLDAFSSSDFDAKSWLNQQLETAETNAPDNNAVQHTQDQLLQKLSTQLHLLATNAQQNSDRTKARFRHQTPQILRDLASMGKLVQETQASVAELSKAVESRLASSHIVENVVSIDTARRQLERTVSALEYLRSYTDLPQKIEALIDTGKLAQAWKLMDSAKCRTEEPSGGAEAEEANIAASVGLGAEDRKRLAEQIEARVLAQLREAVLAHDAPKTAEAAQLLAAHGLGATVESVVVELRLEIGVAQLRPLVAQLDAPQSGAVEGFSAALDLISNLMVQERAFVEAVDTSLDADALLETLLAGFIEVLAPSVQQSVEATENHGSVAGTIELYQTLASFYGDAMGIQSTATLSVGGISSSAASSESLKSKQVSRSLSLLFAPFVPFMHTLASVEANRIRSGSLLRLCSLKPDYDHIERYIRDSTAILVDVFVDIEQALETVFAHVPASKMPQAVAQIASVADEIAAVFRGVVVDISERSGIPAPALDTSADLSALLSYSSPSRAVYQTLANSDKLVAVSSLIGVSLLSRVFGQYASALCVSMGRRWSDMLAQLRGQIDAAGLVDSEPSTSQLSQLMLSAFMESCSTIAEMSDKVAPLLAPADSLAPVVPPEGIAQIQGFGTSLLRTTLSAVFFLLTSAFQPPLAGIPKMAVWHLNKQNKSSMNIVVPSFSCSPSEEAVDIGEKMHILLPELEQIEAMDLQYTRDADLEGAVSALYQCIVSHVGPSIAGGISNKQLSNSAGEEEEEEGLTIQPVLTLVLKTVLKCVAVQICEIEAPLSAGGVQQLIADVDYIASVVSSFTSSSVCREFNDIRRCLWEHQKSATGDDDDSLPPEQISEFSDIKEEEETGGDDATNPIPALDIRSKIQALLSQ
ncbi:hypothetical protein GGI07_001117 [Coemansia sp. Benny D115]|nr:hypothetical protein GGI07_001117 [Coemansia sp. Benny D115]